jgi:transketolase
VAVTVSTSAQVEDLRAHARAVRRASLGMVHRAGVGHPGGDLSAADILVALYFAILAVDPARPALSGRDRLIMSKGHASAVLYATLAEAGFFDAALLRTYMQPSPAWRPARVRWGMGCRSAWARPSPRSSTTRPGACLF